DSPSAARAAGTSAARSTRASTSFARTGVSHFNKAHKGRLAHALVRSRAEPGDLRALARVAVRAGLRVEVTGPATADLVVGAGG
ncbi:hypothetical protein NUG22_13555, partial [Saccharothrix longispora]|nr:hypothetical protein [Saccharothrix longispora]